MPGLKKRDVATKHKRKGVWGSGKRELRPRGKKIGSQIALAQKTEGKGVRPGFILKMIFHRTN